MDKEENRPPPNVLNTGPHRCAPSIPNPTEYRRQRKAKITGYQLKMKFFMFYLNRFVFTCCPRFSSTKHEDESPPCFEAVDGHFNVAFIRFAALPASSSRAQVNVQVRWSWREKR